MEPTESGTIETPISAKLWALLWWVLGTAASVLALGLIGLVLFRICFVDFVENYALGYKFDSRTGTTMPLDHTGYIVNPPIVVSVYSIDLRPMQVCISANSRTLNCKLVKFNPDGLDLFLSWHGNADYSSQSNLPDILKSYAYEGAGKTYPFLTVLRDMTTTDMDAGTLPNATTPTLIAPPQEPATPAVQ